MKRYFPEKGEIRYNGERQYLEEDLGYLTELVALIAMERSVLKLTEEPALRRYISKLEDMYVSARIEFIKKWDRK